MATQLVGLGLENIVTVVMDDAVLVADAAACRMSAMLLSILENSRHLASQSTCQRLPAMGVV